MTRTRWFALACLILAMALWGSSYVVLKVAFRELPPLWVIFGRMALGSLVFLVAWRWRGRIDYRPGDWKYLLGLAVCEPCLYFLCESFALQYTSAAQAGMITALLPLLVAVGAWLLLHERIGRMTWIGFGLAVLGSIWLSLAGEPDLHAPQPLLGNFFELLAMLCATGYTLLLKHLSARYSAFALTAMQAFVGTLFFLPLALASADLPRPPSARGWLGWSARARADQPSQPSARGWLGWSARASADLPSQPSALGIQAVVYLGVVVTVGAYGLYNFGVGRLPASQASGFINLIPVFTLVFAALFLGETLNGPQMLAAGLVFIGVAISQWRSAPPPPPAGVLN
ncbi:DMT family transporter [Pseudomonas aeruginosa]